MPADWANTATLEEVPSLPQSYCWTVGTILKTFIAGWDTVADVCQGHLTVSYCIYTSRLANRLALSTFDKDSTLRNKSLDRAIPCLSNTFGYEQVSRLPYHAVPSAHRFKGDPSFSYVYVLLRCLRIPHWHGLISCLSDHRRGRGE
jgi:hypothetical protein